MTDATPIEAATLLQMLANTDSDFQPQAKPLMQALDGLMLSPSEQNALAQDSLTVLLEDPQSASRLADVQQNTGTHQFSVVGSAAAFAVIVFLFRSHIRIERPASGKWKFRFEHKPMESKLMSALMNKLEKILLG